MTTRPRHYAELLIADVSGNVVAERLGQLRAIATQTRRLSQLATNPVTKASVTNVLNDLQIDSIVQALVMQLAREGRLNWVRSILRAAEASLARSGEAVPAYVTTAHDVVDEAALKRELTKLIGPISTVDVTVNPAELGGIRVQAADRSLDTLLDHRLHQLRRSLERNA